jgi:hypothetical protein
MSTFVISLQISDGVDLEWFVCVEILPSESMDDASAAKTVQVVTADKESINGGEEEPQDRNRRAAL